MTLYNRLNQGSPRLTLFIWILMCVLFFLLNNATSSPARVVTFVWTANPEIVDGYRLYYKTGTKGAPYNGTGAAEGSSPIKAGNVTTFTIHDLLDTEFYYFSLTAYLGTQESDYSEEIVLFPGSLRIISIDELK